jgi:hypothetical protein
MPKQPKPEPLEKCTTDLFSKLENLKKAAILRQALSPSDDSSEFEILEFYGDSVREVAIDLSRCINMLTYLFLFRYYMSA